MAKTTVPGLYIADGAITAAKLSSTLDLSGVTLTVATASTGDSDTSVASTAFVQQEIAALVDSSPSALNTLNELAAAIGDDASFSTTVTNSIATKLALAGGTMTGDLIINTTGSIQIPVGTTAQRPTAAQGQLRFNTTTSKPEIYNGSAWADVGGGVESVNSATGVVVLTTANITENTNLYYTDARADARIAAADTDDLSEGSTNLYFTTARANSAFDGRLSGSTGVTVSNGAVSIGQDIATSTSPTFQNLTLSGTDSIKVPSGTTAQRSGSPANGMLRYNSSTNEFEGYADSAWGAIGGDTTSSVDLYTATGNGSTSTYDTGKNPQSENNTWVFIGGVYQPKSTYSFSGTEITLSENLPNGEDLEVITGTVSTYNPTDAILGQYNVTTSNTASYDTSLTTENENNVFVFVDGVYQPKSSYTYSGSTLTLDAVPTSGMSLEVLVTRSMNAATVTTGFLADDAVTTVKILDANVTAGKLASSLDLTGKTVTVATASAGDNDTSVASTAFVRQEITSLVDSAPAAMDTLNELAAALGDNENFATDVNASIAAKLPLAGGTLTGNLNFGDNDKAVFGAGSDLQIYHNSSNNSSYIDEGGAGDLYVRATNIWFQNTGPTATLAKFTSGGAVELRHNDEIKFATTSTGIDVTGIITFDGGTTSADINFGDNDKAVFGAGSDLQIYHDGSNSIISDEGTGGIKIFTAGVATSGFYKIGGEELATFEPDGPVTLYHNDVAKLATASGGVTVTGTAFVTDGIQDTGQAGSATVFNQSGSTADFRVESTSNTHMLFVDGGTNRVGIGTSAPEEQFSVQDGSGGIIFLGRTSGSTTGLLGRIEMGNTDIDSAMGGIDFTQDGATNSSRIGFFTQPTGGASTERMRIDSSGNVGIGTGNDTLTGKLTVKDSGTLDINLIGNPPELNVEDTSSTSGTKRARFTLDNNKVKIEGLADDDQSVTQSFFVGNLSNGKVHIGGTDPEEKLDVEGAIKVGAALQIGSNGTGQIGFNRNTFDGNYYTSGLQRFQINGPFSGSDYLHFQNYSSGGTYLDGLYINGGKVGVGVNAPGEKFQVNGAIAVTGSLIDDRTATGTMDYVSGITRFVAYGGSGSENGQIAFNTAVGGGSSTVKARISAGFTNTSTTALPAFRTEGSYGGGIGMLDGVSQAGWYQQDSGDTFHHYVGKESSDTPASKIVLTTRSNGHVGIMQGGSSAINHPLHVTREEAGYQVKFDNDNGSGQGLAIRIKANDSGNFNAINTVSASSGSDKTVFNVRDDGIVTTPEQVYFLARRDGHLSGYNMAATTGATTTIFNYLESGHSSAAGIAAFSTTDGTFSAPVDGLYLFHYSFYSNNTIEQAWFTSNGARINWTDVTANTEGSYTGGVLAVSMQYYMSAGASIRVHPYSSGSSSVTIYENNYHTYWKGILIG
ncbi:hypothetical protein OAA25_00695 [bacterium]|nr:hypothetical protein [bacterium]